MIGFMLSDNTRIVNLKGGYLKYKNKDEILILRNDTTPILLIKEEKGKLKFYELDNITKEERNIIDNIYEITLINICNEIRGFIALSATLGMIDYSKVLDITKFKDGYIMVA